MPEQFTITSVERCAAEDWGAPPRGPYHVYRIGVRNAMKSAEEAQCSRKPTSPLLQVGETVEGDLTTDSLHGSKFKVAPGSGPRNDLHQMPSPAASAGLSQATEAAAGEIRYGYATHPTTVARMARENLHKQRCHSQEMALRYCELAMQTGAIKPEQFNLTGLFLIADKFDEDVQAVKADEDIPF